MENLGFAAIILAFMSPSIVAIWAAAKYGGATKEKPNSEQKPGNP